MEGVGISELCDAESSVMYFNYDSAGIWLTDIPPLAIADFFPSSADVSEKLNSASSVFRLFLAILEKNVVLVEVPVLVLQQQLLVIGHQQG